MPPVQSKIWSHFHLEENAALPGVRGNKRVCKYCGHKVHATQLSRARNHLFNCKKAPETLDNQVVLVTQGTLQSQTTTNAINSGVLQSQTETTAVAPVNNRRPSSATEIDRFVFRTSDDKKKEYDILCAELIFELNLSFRVSESDVFRAYSHALNPSYKPPSRKTIGGSLLDEIYGRRKSELTQFLATEENLTLVSDGWSNIRHDHIVNFVIVKQYANGTSDSYFFSSKCTNGTEQTAENVFKDMDQVIQQIGPDKLCAVVTDNCRVMQAVWDKIEDKYPQIFANGCAAHVLNLLIKDIFETRDYMDVLDKAKFLSKFIRNHMVILDKFRRIQEANKHSGVLNCIKALELPIETRWYSSHGCVRSVLLNRPAIQTTFVDREFNTRIRSKGIREIEQVLILINDNSFWVKLESLDRMISPITKAIGKVESDSVELSKIYNIFHDLRSNAAIKDKVDYRWHFLHTESMGMSYLLDPRTEGGEGFMGNDKADSYESLIRHFAIRLSDGITDEERTNEERECFKAELNGYMATIAQQNSQSAMKKIAKDLSPLTFWTCWGSGYPRLQKIAISIFSTCTSSAASERVWSTFDFIHSKRRNRLQNSKVEKLVFIYANSTRLKNNLMLTTDQTSDSEDD
jgi:hypothetical protein